jgi:hypothetical protein
MGLLRFDSGGHSWPHPYAQKRRDWSGARAVHKKVTRESTAERMTPGRNFTSARLDVKVSLLNHASPWADAWLQFDACKLSIHWSTQHTFGSTSTQEGIRWSAKVFNEPLDANLQVALNPVVCGFGFQGNIHSSCPVTETAGHAFFGEDQLELLMDSKKLYLALDELGERMSVSQDFAPECNYLAPEGKGCKNL